MYLVQTQVSKVSLAKQRYIINIILLLVLYKYIKILFRIISALNPKTSKLFKDTYIISALEMNKTCFQTEYIRLKQKKSLFQQSC